MARGLVLPFLLLFGSSVQAQTGATHPHTITASTQVDGAVHPELIGDPIAYRLYFAAVSTGTSPTDSDRRRQMAQLSTTGLNDADIQNLVTTLSEFKAKHDELVRQYNEAATAAQAHNEFLDIHSLLQSLNSLIGSTREVLRQRLSSRGLAQLHAFVQSEKRHMKVAAEDQ